jgi:hypothetical protein
VTAEVPGITETDLKKVILAVQQLAAGRSNATGTVTLATGAATTVVVPTQSGMIAPGSNVTLEARTAAAAAERALGNMFVSSVGKDTFTIAHANNGIPGRTFSYVIQG